MLLLSLLLLNVISIDLTGKSHQGSTFLCIKQFTKEILNASKSYWRNISRPLLKAYIGTAYYMHESEPFLELTLGRSGTSITYIMYSSWIDLQFMYHNKKVNKVRFNVSIRLHGMYCHLKKFQCVFHKR